MRRALIVLALPLVFVTACSDSSKNDTATPTDQASVPATAERSYPPQNDIDACGLLKDEEVEALLGKPDQPPYVFMDRKSQQMCIWETQPTYLRINVNRAFDVSVLPANKPEVPGLGDEAYRAKASLYARKGDVWVIVRGAGDKDEEIMQLALGRL